MCSWCFLWEPLNTDTRLIRKLWHVLFVSVLTGFHCITFTVTYLFYVTSQKKKTVYWTPRHTEKQNKKKQSKQELFRVAPVQNQCLCQYINQALLLNLFLQNVSPYLLLPLSYSVHDGCIPSPSICLSPHSRLFASNSR